MNLDKRLLHLVRFAKSDLGFSVFFSFLGGISAIFLAYNLSKIVSLVFLNGKTLEELMPYLWAFLFLAIARALTIVFSAGFSGRVADTIKGKIKEMLFSHILDLGPAFTQGEQSGELTSVVVQGVDALDPYFSQYLPQLALAALIPLSILIAIFPTDWLSGLVLLVTAPLIIVFMVLIGKNSEKLTQHQWETLSRMSAFFLDTIQGLTTLKALNQSRQRLDDVAETSEKYRQTTLKVLEITFLSALALELVSTISTAVVAVEIGLRLLYGNLEFQQAFFMNLAPEYYLPLRMLGTRFHAGMSGVTAAKRIFAILDTPVMGNNLQTGMFLNGLEITAIKEQGKQPADTTINLHDPFILKFEDAGFQYPDRHLPAVEKLNFEIPYRKVTALVGESGSGKSTLIQMLLKFIEPQHGKILFNGLDLKNIPDAQWRAEIAWVPQIPYLFNEPFKYNLGFGSPAASLEELRETAKSVHLDDFIMGLPGKYDTIIGERGARLSSGQAQRLALGRALLTRAPFIIMDEPAAHLDLLEEKYLSSILEKLSESRTVVMIGHRIASLRKADQVLLLEKGKIVESGIHSILMERHGLYYGMVKAARESL